MSTQGQTSDGAGEDADSPGTRAVPEPFPAGRLAPAHASAPSDALAEAQSAVTRALQRRAMQPLGLDPATADLLVQLYVSPECGIRGVEIGEQCQMTATRVSRLVDRAEADGLVERRPDPLDRRAQHVVLTDEGRRLARRYVPLRDAVLRDVFLEALSASERAELEELLGRVRDHARALLAAD